MTIVPTAAPSRIASSTPLMCFVVLEMRTYEDDVDTTLIESGNRKEGKRQKG